jgi:hypothetical protein
MNDNTAQSAIVCGLTPLIPVPILDSYAERQLLKSAYARLAQDNGISLDEETLKILTDDKSNLLSGCVWVMIKWPIKKLFRTILYFLTIKDVIDTTTRTAHRLAVFKVALDSGLIPARAKEVREAMDLALARTDHSPVTRVLVRGARPPPPTWQPKTGALYSLVAHLHQHGGGATIVENFQKNLDQKLFAATPDLPEQDKPAPPPS